MSQVPDLVDQVRMVVGPREVAFGQSLLLAYVRVLPVVMFSPLLGGQLAPVRVRMVAAIVLAMCAFLASAAAPLEAPIAGLTLAGAVLWNIVVGLLPMVGVNAVFAAYTMAAEAMDLTRGATIANVIDPVSRQPQPSLLAPFYTSMLLAGIGIAGAIPIMVREFAVSITSLPLAGVGSGVVGVLSVQWTIGLVADAMGMALRISAPVLLIVLLIDTAMTVIERSASGAFKVRDLGAAIKGPASLAIAAFVLAALLPEQVLQVVRNIARALEVVGR